MHHDETRRVSDTSGRSPVAGVVLLAESTALAGGSGSVDDLVAAVRAAVVAGVRTVIVRDKHRHRDDRAAIVAAVNSLGASVLLAADGPGPLLGADGLHLSARPERCQTPFGTRSGLRGMSCHDAGEIERAVAAGVDYVTVSPVYPTASKPGYGPALGPEGLAALVARCPVPAVALGGVTSAEAVVECRDAGAAGVAVMGAVLRADDPGSVTATLVAPFLENPARERPETEHDPQERSGRRRGR